MELLTNHNPSEMILDETQIIKRSSSNFIEANTKEVHLEHLKNDCIIPVFAKDNESTISHFQFIDKTFESARELFPNNEISQPQIRVSHVIKGRTPSAIGKPVKELLEHEKTIYYERCAFLIDIPEIKQTINGCELNLSIGGVRAVNQENLYSNKSLEKFKVFVGFKNMVCTNLCISTDGFSNEIRIGSIGDLEGQIQLLLDNYNKEDHLQSMNRMGDYQLSEMQFAHLIGKLRMYLVASKEEKLRVFDVSLNDRQIANVVRDYYSCANYKRNNDGTIGLWNLYNLLTQANKSSYIDNNLERNVNAYELIQNLGLSMETGTSNWLLPSV
jgi:hypothetical protein